MCEQIEKEEAREIIRCLRSCLTPAEKEEMSLAAARRLFPLLKHAPRVLCYADLPKEAGTRELVRLLRTAGVRVAFPKVEGEKIAFYEADSFGELIPGAMNIPEPSGTAPPVFWPEAPVVTPGLAFDRRGGRAGYGGGFYDRFFAEEPDHTAIGFCFGFQVTEKPLRLSSHDRRMDLLATENGIFSCHGGGRLENKRL